MLSWEPALAAEVQSKADTHWRSLCTWQIILHRTVAWPTTAFESCLMVIVGLGTKGPFEGPWLVGEKEEYERELESGDFLWRPRQSTPVVQRVGTID